MVGSEIGRLPPTFNDASKVANAILTSGYDFDEGKLLFNYYKSVVSNETLEIPIYSQGKVFCYKNVYYLNSCFVFQTLSPPLRRLVCMTPWTLMLSSHTWSTAWPPWFTTA